MLKREPFLEEGDLIDIEPAFITTTYHRVDNVAEWDEDISEGNIPPDTGFGNSNFPLFEQGAGLYNSGNSWIIMGAYKSEEDDDENKVPVAGGDWTLDMDEDNGDDPEETHSFLSFRQFQSNLFRENSSQTTHNDLKNLLKTEGTFDDYHMLVGSEVIKIRDHFVDDNYYPKLAMFKLLRGQGGTTAYGHVPGETVKLYAPDVSPEDIVAKEDATLLARTDLIDRNVFNPIYMLFELTAHAPSDKRDSRWQVMQINNLDCYDINNNRKSTTFQFDQMYSYETFGNESGGGIDDSALKITDMQVTVNTNTSTPNDWTVNSSKDDRNTYKQFFNFIKPPFTFDPTLTDKTILLNVSPKNALDNEDEASLANNMTGSFPDYFPKQHIGVVNINTDELESDVYLDEYRDNQNERIQSIGSAPALISFDFEIVDIEDTSMESLLPTSSTPIADIYYYFVIDWDDRDDEIKTLEDWEENRPTNLRELFELQEDNLYKLVRHNQERLDAVTHRIQVSERLTNNYTSPGIKTIKTIIFSYNENSKQIGRWKLLTSRFYLDIPSNQYPDFEQVGGADYTTIPWPYTTPVIAGISNESRYKKSVQETLSSGNIGNTDIIDETFLINDLENDELGESINQMDLEQVRYFNKSYDMNKLLNIVFNEEFVGEPIYLTTDAHLRTLTGYYGGGIVEGDIPMNSAELSWTDNAPQGEFTESDIEQWNAYGRPDIANFITEVVAGTVDFNPTITDEDGNQTFDFDGEGGGIDEGGIDGSEPHFQGGHGGSGGGIDDPGGDPDFPPNLPQFDFRGPNINGQYQSGDELEILWYQIEDYTLYEDIPSYGDSYYQDLASESENPDAYFPSRWQKISIYLDKKVGSNYVEDRYVGTVGSLGSNATLKWEEYGDVQNPYEKRFVYTIPSIDEETTTDRYRVRLVAFHGNDEREVSMTGGDIQITFTQTPIGGCMDPNAENYNPSATFDDGTCSYAPIIVRPKEDFANPVFQTLTTDVPNFYTDTDFWDGGINKFPMESSVGQIFISDNQNVDLKQSCKLELNGGELTTNSIYDSSGNSNKGLLIGDYRIKKDRKGEPMRRDSFIKFPKKTSNENGAL
jgi:hypothetical protein